jgi:hypothetical protein
MCLYSESLIVAADRGIFNGPKNQFIANYGGNDRFNELSNCGRCG